jgi:Alphavirus glycoprotein J
VKVLLCASVAAAAFAGALVRPVTAAAGAPCWKTLLNDWYDGRIDNTYPIHCYRDALHHLPKDVDEYSSAREDITRALQNAKVTLRHEGKSVTPTTPVPPQTGGPKGSGGPNTTKTSTTTPTTTTTSVPTPTPSPGKHSGKGLTRLADKLNPSNPDSLPLPLIVLGGLAILLVAAGGAGLLAKRLQGRKPSP